MILWFGCKVYFNCGCCFFVFFTSVDVLHEPKRSHFRWKTNKPINLLTGVILIYFLSTRNSGTKEDKIASEEGV